MKLDQDISTFQMSLPARFHRTIFEGDGRSISHSKVMIILIINLSIILLHECFITKEELNLSSERCLEAVSKIKSIGSLIFDSAFDSRLLHPFTNYCWAVAVRMMMRQLVQNEIRLIELATRSSTPEASSTHWNAQASVYADYPKGSDEIHRVGLDRLLKIEQDKVNQNMLEIESLLRFNPNIQRRNSKVDLNFPPLASPPTTHDVPHHDHPRDPFELNLIPQHSICPDHRLNLIHGPPQPILGCGTLNPIDPIDHQAPQNPYPNSHLPPPLPSHPPTDPILASFISQSFDSSRPRDHQASESLRPSHLIAQEDHDHLDGISRLYFDQLIILFQIRFQAFSLPESLSRVV